MAWTTFMLRKNIIPFIQMALALSLYLIFLAKNYPQGLLENSEFWIICNSYLSLSSFLLLPLPPFLCPSLKQDVFSCRPLTISGLKSGQVPRTHIGSLHQPQSARSLEDPPVFLHKVPPVLTPSPCFTNPAWPCKPLSSPRWSFSLCGFVHVSVLLCVYMCVRVSRKSKPPCFVRQDLSLAWNLQIL